MRGLKPLVKNLYFWLASQSPAMKKRLAYLSESRAVVVLNLHRVAQDDGSAYRPLSPYLFDELLDFVMKNFRITTFSEIDVNYNGAQIVLSFDDGYTDFLENVVPCAEKKQIRVNQNIIPQCVESGLPPLNVLAQDFIGKAPDEIVCRIDIPGLGKKVSKGDAQSISNFIKFLSARERADISEYLKNQFFKWSDFQPTRMMGLHQINQIKDLHELGAHSFAHDSLGSEDDDFAEDDARQCKNWFHEKLGLNPNIYAFPNGSYNKSQVERIRRQGFTHLLFVDESINSLSAKSDGEFKRLTFDAQGVPEMKFRAMGKFERLPN